ncbi:hypothetical protein TWF696_001752 [Orbilia brochopaga]|uniref:Uncharacterized protein n=1 Tax=Orbilia brochopaga TaxID=3140254 RepID=A0AAV9U7B5_9PEZI
MTLRSLANINLIASRLTVMVSAPTAAYKLGTARKFARTLTSDGSPSPSGLSVGSIIISEFKKADIGVTKPGQNMILSAYASLHSSDLGRPELPRILSEMYKECDGPGNPENLMCVLDRSECPWRLQEAFWESMDYKVHKMWEALYPRSELFRRMINEEEDYVRNSQFHDLVDVRDVTLWHWLESMVIDGVFEWADVDKLPEPFKLKDLIDCNH